MAQQCKMHATLQTNHSQGYRESAYFGNDDNVQACYTKVIIAFPKLQ